ncbi:MAG: DUF4241 domain-containing protein [Flavihumibacter sp.]
MTNTPSIPAFLEDVFHDGFTFTNPDGTRYEFYCQPIGDLPVRDGRIIACDPFIFMNDEPFTAQFPTGNFPLELAIARLQDDERIGFARIRFSAAAPVRWAFALTASQNPATLEEGYYFGYPVDAGTGSFMDQSAAATFAAFFDRDEKNFERLIDWMQATYKNTRSWYLFKEGPATVAMFSSGWGDGLYPSLIGYDAGGGICRLVTDFLLLAWPDA